MAGITTVNDDQWAALLQMLDGLTTVFEKLVEEQANIARKLDNLGVITDLLDSRL